MKLKSTTWVLLAVVVILAGMLIAGGGRLWRRVTAPRIERDVTSAPTSAVTAPEATTPAVGVGWEAKRDPQSGRTHLVPPPAEEQALREAFAVLLHRTRARQADAGALLTYARDLSVAQARV